MNYFYDLNQLAHYLAVTVLNKFPHTELNKLTQTELNELTHTAVNKYIFKPKSITGGLVAIISNRSLANELFNGLNQLAHYLAVTVRKNLSGRVRGVGYEGRAQVCRR